MPLKSLKTTIMCTHVSALNDVHLENLESKLKCLLTLQRFDKILDHGHLEKTLLVIKSMCSSLTSFTKCGY